MFNFFKNIKGNMKSSSTSTVTINGVTYTSTNNSSNVTIKNGRVIINGTDVTPNEKVINITVNGNIETLQADVCNEIKIVGNVGDVKTSAGDIDITGSVVGDVRSSAGNIDVGGTITGSAHTSAGNIKYRK